MPARCFGRAPSTERWRLARCVLCFGSEDLRSAPSPTRHWGDSLELEHHNRSTSSQTLGGASARMPESLLCASLRVPAQEMNAPAGSCATLEVNEFTGSSEMINEPWKTLTSPWWFSAKDARSGIPVPLPPSLDELRRGSWPTMGARRSVPARPTSSDPVQGGLLALLNARTSGGLLRRLAAPADYLDLANYGGSQTDPVTHQRRTHA
jgi:hypothetical protein